MGAALTTQNAKSNLELRKQIDYIAKNFIFDSDFTDMTKLGNEKYCNRLVKKVSDVFKNNKDSIDIVLHRKKLYEIKIKWFKHLTIFNIIKWKNLLLRQKSMN